MKNKILILIFISMLLCSCDSSNGKTYTPEELDKQLALSYYKGIYDTCIYAATNDKQSDPEGSCLETLSYALDNDWYNFKGWPPMPPLTPLDSNTPIPSKLPGG